LKVSDFDWKTGWTALLRAAADSVRKVDLLDYREYPDKDVLKAVNTYAVK
jgi:hypothetical protein